MEAAELRPLLPERQHTWNCVDALEENVQVGTTTRQDQEEIGEINEENKLNQVKVAGSEFSESSTQYHNLNKKCKKLEQQLIDMKNFLKDYGLIWVGDGGNQNSNIADNTLQREKGVWRPDDSITGELVSFDLLLENIKYLNILANEGEAKITYTASGATFKDPISLPLTIYSNGIVLKSEPFRSYMEPSTQIFVADILDGFFPTELQAQYPEGVSFKVIDKRSVTYKGSENGWKAFNGVGYKLGDKLSEQNKEVSSSSLSNHYNTPKQPCKNNNSTYYENSAHTQEEERTLSEIEQLRRHTDDRVSTEHFLDKVSKIKAGDDRMLTYTREGVTHPPSVQQVIHNSISKYTISSDNIVLKVWSEDGSKVYMIHISADETVMSLEKLLDENRKILSNSELSARCGYRLYASNHLGRKTSLANTSLTLREYGITCNTVLYMQKTEAEQDHTGVVPFVNEFI
uniref:UBX domain-containing protein 11 n=1 Tax=Timema poppense TaxID=170557 RepID=A0A7R9D321_TIMPO|nr:unnamed protein product [Timema poppensis]